MLSCGSRTKSSCTRSPQRRDQAFPAFWNGINPIPLWLSLSRLNSEAGHHPHEWHRLPFGQPSQLRSYNTLLPSAGNGSFVWKGAEGTPRTSSGSQLLGPVTIGGFLHRSQYGRKKPAFWRINIQLVHYHHLNDSRAKFKVKLPEINDFLDSMKTYQTKPCFGLSSNEPGSV